MLTTLQALVDVGESMLAACEQEQWQQLAELDLQRRELLQRLTTSIAPAGAEPGEIDRFSGRLQQQDEQLRHAVASAHQAVLQSLRAIRSGRVAQKAYTEKPTPG